MPFPADALPSWLAATTREVSAATQTDPSMTAMSCLGALSAAVARKAVVVQSSGRTSQLNLWLVTIAEATAGKSSVFGHVVAPLRRILTSVPEEPPAAPPTPRTMWDHLIADDEEDRSAAADTDSAPIDELTPLRAAQEFVLEAQHRARPDAALEFAPTTSTPARLRELLGTQVLGVSLLSSEAGVLSTLGNVSRSQLDEVAADLNLAWDGATIVREQRTRRIPPIERPSLVLGLMPQPHVFQRLTAARALHETGLLARVLYCFALSHRGRQTYASFHEPDARVMAQYRANLWSLLALPFAGLEMPHRLRLSSEGEEEFGRFFDDIERRRADGEDLAEVATWAARLRDNALRISGLLHLAEHIVLGEQAYHESISGESMGRRVQICRGLIADGLQAMGAVDEADQIAVRLQQVISARESFRDGEFSARDLHRSVQRSYNAEQVGHGLERLLTRAVIERVAAEGPIRYRLLRER